MNSAQTRGVENLASNNSRFCGSKASSREKWISPSVLRASMAVATERNIEHKIAKASSISCRQINHNQGIHACTSLTPHSLGFFWLIWEEVVLCSRCNWNPGLAISGPQGSSILQTTIECTKMNKYHGAIARICLRIHPLVFSSRHRKWNRGRATKLDLCQGGTVVQRNLHQ